MPLPDELRRATTALGLGAMGAGTLALGAVSVAQAFHLPQESVVRGWWWGGPGSYALLGGMFLLLVGALTRNLAPGANAPLLVGAGVLGLAFVAARFVPYSWSALSAAVAGAGLLIALRPHGRPALAAAVVAILAGLAADVAIARHPVDVWLGFGLVESLALPAAFLLASWRAVPRRTL
jgi:hypothetical protein